MQEEYKISLAAARKNAEMTQEDIAREMKVTKQTIVNWENGKTEMKPAQFEMYCRLVNAPKDAISLPMI